MKKLALLLTFSFLVAFASAQSVRIEFWFGIPYNETCSSGPLKLSGKGAHCWVDNVTAGQTINFNLTIRANGVIRYMKDTTFVANSPNAHIYLPDVEMDLPGPGSYSIVGTGTATIGSNSYSGTHSQTLAYGPSECDTYHGRIYLDRNANCQYDTGDSLMANQQVMVGFGNAQKYYTNSAGEYQFMGPKTYQTSIQASKKVTNPNMAGYFPLTCPSSGAYYGIVYNTTSYDFGYSPNQVHNSSTTSSYYFAYSESGAACEMPSTYIHNPSISTDAPYTLYLNFGDGTDTTINRYGPGQQEYDSIMIAHTYMTAGTFHPYVTFTFKDTVVRETLTDPIVVSGDCGNVSGMVYKDENENCTFQSSVDVPLVHRLVVLTVNGKKHYAYTDNAGNYFFQVPNNTPYTLQLGGTDSTGVYLNSEALVVCPGKYNNSTASASNDFALQCVNGARDYYVSMKGWGFRPGFNNGQLHVAVHNRACHASSGTLVVELDPKEGFVKSSPAPSRVNGNTLEYDFANVGASNPFLVSIQVSLPQNTTIGDSVCHTATANPLQSDKNPTDNVMEYCEQVRGSWDPNDKTAYVNDGLKAGNGLLKDDFLLYRVRFQNTGTDTAFNIYILDNIDPNLDLTTLRIISSSHPMKVYMSDDRVVRFEFNDILLPDDKTNEPASHGYIYYRIRPVKNIAVGTHLNNTANIYFDYNEPVITNTTDNVIETCKVPQMPGSISGDNSVCKSTTGVVYTVPAIENATGYEWQLPAGASIVAGANTRSITVDFGTGAVNGAITVKGYNDCAEGSVSAQFMVTVNDLPTVGATASAPEVCAGSAVTLSGTGAATYTWSGGVQNNVAFTPSATATYTVTGRSAEGCENTSTIAVVVNPLPNVQAAASDNEICIGESVTLAGSGAVSYEWTNDVANNVPFAPEATATYTVTGTDAKGCENAATLSVTVHELPTIDATASASVVCLGDEITLNGEGGVSYVWSGGVENGVPFAPEATSTYVVEGTDAYGCVNRAELTVTVNPLPVPEAWTSDEEICAGEPTDLFIEGGVTYRWDNGVLNGQPFTPEATATYTGYITDANGCEGSATVSIVVNPLPEVTQEPLEPVCVDAAPFELSGGLPAGGTYSGPGVFDGWFKPMAAGIGSHQVVYEYTDEKGCRNSTMQPQAVESCTGIADLSGQPYQAYPNPFGNVITLNGLENSETITLFNLLGEKVYSTVNTGNRAMLSIRTDELPKGIYLMSVSSDKGEFNTRIVKQ